MTPSSARSSFSKQLSQSLQQPLIQYLLLFLVVMCVHLPTLWFTYVWDDTAMIVQNESLRQWKYLPTYFTDPNTFMHDPGDQYRNEYRPLRNVYYLITFQIHQFHPAGWHFQHVLLHSLVSSLVLAFFHRLYRFAKALRYYEILPVPVQLGTWLAVLVWAVHPVNTEVTAWLKSADDLLSCILTLAALCLLFPSAALLTYRRATIAAILFAASFYAKESIAPVPLIYMMLGLVLSPNRAEQIRRPVYWYTSVLLFLGLFIYIAVRKAMLGQLEQVPYMAGNFSLMMATMTTAVVRYMQITFWPFWPTLQVGDYNGWPLAKSWLEPRVIKCTLIVLAAVVVAAWASWKSRIAFAGLMFAVIAFLPVANIIPMMQVMADRFLYFPLIGISLVASIVFAYSIAKHKVLIVPVVGLAIALAACNLQWQKVWVDNESFQINNTQADFENPRALFNKAAILKRNGNTTGSLEILIPLYQRYPAHIDAAMLTADVYLSQGNTTAAISLLKDAKVRFPQSVRPPGFLGDIARTMDDHKLAAEYYDEALKYQVDIPALHYWHGMTYKELGNLEVARRSFKNTLKADDPFTSAELELKNLGPE